MASRQATIDHILAQTRAAGFVSARKMFGEYGLYLDGTLFALVCDDVLYLKPTPAGRAADLAEAAPYPGAKPYLVVSEDLLDDAERLVALIRATVAALPAPRPPKPRPSKPRPAKPRPAKPRPTPIRGQ